MTQQLDHHTESGPSLTDGESAPSDQSGPRRSDQPSVLAIGDDSFVRMVRDLLARGETGVSVEPVSTYLMALGRLATMRPRAIIGQAEGLSDHLLLTVSALRQLAPSARLILIHPGNDTSSPQRALDAGFDCCLASPPAPEVLARAMMNGHARSNVGRDDDWLISNLPHIQVLTTSDHIRTLMTPRDRASGYADVDLLDRLLRSHCEIRGIALKMLVERTGMGQIGWIDDAEQPPAGYRVAPVVYDGANYGKLHAPENVDQRALQQAAGWLGRWLALQRRLRMLTEMAFKDDLTGAWNRRYFNRALDSILQRAAQDRFSATLMMFDIDDFKHYNDRYGHAAGDDILREAARLMGSVVREHDVVARIGGDEFAVIFWDAEQPRQPNSQHPVDVLAIAQRFQKAICSHQFPKLLGEVKQTLTISGGLAGFPWDGRTPEELMDKADQMAILSKRQGKNAITLGPGAERACRAIRAQNHSST